MELEAYECKSCGTLTYLPKGINKLLWCPLCRGGMVKIEIGEKRELVEYNCPKCKVVFYLEKGVEPYKCSNCNFTFITTPRRRQEERL